MNKPLVALAAAGAFFAAPATAQTVRASDPQTLVEALQDTGYKAELARDSVGDPMIKSASSGSDFRLLFYGCTSGKRCQTVQFLSGYEVDKPVTLARINEWNRTKRFARAFLDDEQDPLIVMDLDLDDGGMSKALFVDNLEFWVTLLASFEEFIGYSD